MNKVSELCEKTTKVFSLSLIAGLLILINAVALGVVARWFPCIMLTLPGSSGNDPALLYNLSTAGLIFAVFLLVAIMLYIKPASKRAWAQ